MKGGGLTMGSGNDKRGGTQKRDGNEKSSPPKQGGARVGK